MVKSLLKFILIFIVSQIITYYLAGMLAQLVLGAGAYYPPSPTALSYLKNPQDPSVQLWILPAQALRGVLFALILFPFRQRIQELGVWIGGAALGGIIFITGYVAASGGMIEHFVFFSEYPARFAAITFVEVLFQTLLIGLMVVRLDRRYNPLPAIA